MNRNLGELLINVGGESFVAKLPVNSLCALETVSGMDATVVVSELLETSSKGKINFTLLRAILWASLIAKHPTTTLEKAGALMDQLGIEGTMKVVMDLIPITFPDTSKKEDGEARVDP